MADTETPWMTRTEAAAHIRVDPKTIDRLAADGKIIKYGEGRLVRYRRDELDELMNAPTRVSE